MKKIIILFVFLFFVCGCTNNNEEKLIGTVKKVDCMEEKTLLGEGAVLIDVRSSGEFEESHLEGAINIEYGLIEDKISSVVDSKDTNIIVYCQSGKRSSIVADTLISLGYSNVYDLGSIDNC